MDGGSQASRPAPAGQCTGRGRSPGALLLGRSATGIRRRGPVQAPQGLSPVFQPATHVISSAIGLASARRVAIAILFSLPGSARSPRGHRMQGLRFFFGVRDPRETQGHRGVRIGVFQLPWTVLIMGG
ncbi:hypothetical protein NDU88_002902 [Pleurodeles waltl]|uniref:Uncharacterized protein n=1 Tax=Pleurodeles waltl TaxID=8319 RepID=A0AAV7M1Z5_PLEWA|nr:hypothetical protein NDU88_002902 [Pleurodeles waltl]